MTNRDYDIIAERLVGKVAKHARHSANCNVLQSAKSIAYIFAQELFKKDGDVDYYNHLQDAIARVCPEDKMMENFKNRKV